jgi:hypothetical protein
MCPNRTLVALKREAIFGQFLSLIQDEIRGSYHSGRLSSANYCRDSAQTGHRIEVL